MAIGKRPRSNPWVAAGITFIVLFLIATVLAVVLYLNLEKQLKAVEEMQTQQDELINSRQWSTRGTIIGSKPIRQTYIGMLLQYLDDMAYTILGSPREDTSAEVKAQTVSEKISQTMATLNNAYPDMASVDVNAVGLLGTIGRLKNKLDNTVTEITSLQQQIQDLQTRFDNAMKSSREKEQALLEEKEKLAAKANEVQKSYDELKALMDKSTEDQVKALLSDLDEQRQRADELNQELLKTQAELNVASEMLRQAREQLRDVMGSPDMEAAARESDGEIMLLDEHSKTVHLNIGSEDHVYPGLTFGVYDRNVPIPRDGKGKAEIEVFSVLENISTARIVNSNPRNPILVGDIVANLVWDSRKTHIFVVAGDFDLDGDGVTDYQAGEKIRALIEEWAGKVEKAVSVNTDFVVLGVAPTVLARPTYDQLSIDPLAMDKYEASLKNLEHYKQVRKQAEALAIPILNYDRFLYLIGYKTQSARPGAFGG